MVAAIVGVLGLASVGIGVTIWGIMSGQILAQATDRDAFLGFLFTLLQLELVGIVLWAGQEEYKRARSRSDTARSQLENQLRARSEARRVYLEDTAHRVRHAYIDVKRCRRILKARLGGTVDHDQPLEVQLLYAQGEELMRPQLELEGLKWEVKGAAVPGGLVPEASDLVEHLRSMEAYANDLSKALMRFTIPPNPKHVQMLGDFVGRYEGSNFAAQFGMPYDELAKILMRERAS